MTALDYCLYDNRTPSIRSGEDWDLKAATGALGRREDLRRAFRAYCKLSHGDDGHPEGYDAAVGGWRQSSAPGYLLCVTLETPDRRNRHSLAVIGLWCPDRDTLGALIDAGDPIETARPILTMSRLPARLEIRGRAVPRGRGLKTPEKTAYVRFRRGESVPLALSLLDGAAFGTLPSILGITATSKLTEASKQGFRIVFSAPAPTDERAQAALARLEIAPTALVERELPTIVFPYPAATSASPRIEAGGILGVADARADAGTEAHPDPRTHADALARELADVDAPAGARDLPGLRPLDAAASRSRPQAQHSYEHQEERQDSSTKTSGFPEIPMVPLAPPSDRALRDSALRDSALRDGPPSAPPRIVPAPTLPPARRPMHARVVVLGLAAAGCLLLAGGVYIAWPRILPLAWRMRAGSPAASTTAPTSASTTAATAATAGSAATAGRRTTASAEPSESGAHGASSPSSLLSSTSASASPAEAEAATADTHAAAARTQGQQRQHGQTQTHAQGQAYENPDTVAARERDATISGPPIEALRERLRALTALDPARLRESPAFIAAAQVDVVNAHAADRARVQRAYATLIEQRRQLLQPDWLRGVEYYITGVGAGAPRDERERRLTQLLGTTAAGPRACETLREAFGAELASTTSAENLWCRTLTRIQAAATALDRPPRAQSR